jgi:hypothetical protein
VARFAQRYPVPGIIIVADAPGHDMGCIDGRMTRRCQNANSTEGALMAIRRNDCATETLISNGFSFFMHLIRQVGSGLFEEFLTIDALSHVSSPG